MTIYDPIGNALGVQPIHFTFDKALLNESTEKPDPFVIRLVGEEHPMYGKERNDLSEFNKSRTGIKLQQDHRDKISLGVKNSSKWVFALENNLMALNGERNGMYGKKHSEEAKKVMSEKAKLRPKIYGRKLPEKTRIENIERFKLMPKIICPHCNKETDRGNYVRWHGDNCKLAKNKS